MRLLFITWDGPQVQYLESLFLPIFAGLRDHGIATDVLQFRWGSQEQTDAIARLCADAGSGYCAVTVARRFGGAGAVATALAGAYHVRRAVRQFGSDVLVPRSLMPALATLAAGGSSLAPILFDADGLAADERVEFGGTRPDGIEYRALRRIEARAVRQAAAVMVRTTAAASILAQRADISPARFHVVRNGRDERIFTPATAAQRAASRAELGIAADVPLLAYAGSAGPQYRFDAIAATALALLDRHPGARLLVLSGEPESALAQLVAADPRIAPMLVVRQAAPADVPRFLAVADAGLAYRATSFSTRAIAPIKLGEYLLCGLPAIGTAAVGDTAAAVAAGVFLDEAAGPASAAEWLLSTILPRRDAWRETARAVGQKHFSLERSIEDYRRAIDAVVPLIGVRGNRAIEA